jgi:dCTP deaminase
VGILSDRAILAALDSGRLRIEPRPAPGPGATDSPFSTCSIDLRLSSTLHIPRQGLQLGIDVRGRITPTLDALYEQRKIPPEGFLLRPNQFVLARTMEEVSLPLSEPCLTARVEGRSSFARAGLLVHFTAPTIHAGFEGRIALEMINLGEFSLVLRTGSPICQLIIETVEGVPIGRDSQFQGQASAIGAL